MARGHRVLFVVAAVFMLSASLFCRSGTGGAHLLGDVVG